MGKKHYKKQRGLSKEEIFGWILFCVVFYVVLSVNMVWLFTTNCVFEWPPRFDVSVCWEEQKLEAKENAADAAGNFMPKLKH